MTDTGKLMGEFAVAKAAYDDAKAALADARAALVHHISTRYPDAWRRVREGKATTLTAEGVTLKTTRRYDPDKLRPLIGEEHPEVFEQVWKVDGRKMAALVKDENIADQAAPALEPLYVSVQIK